MFFECNRIEESPSLEQGGDMTTIIRGVGIVRLLVGAALVLGTGCDTSGAISANDADQEDLRHRHCGNGICEPRGSETCLSCPQDCGVCAPVCGDGACSE